MDSFRIWLESESQLPLSSVTEQGIVFKTGVPVTFAYIHGTDKAGQHGSVYQQDIEVAGKYMVHNEEPGDRPPAVWDIGKKTFQNPLVIRFNLKPFSGYNESSWKAVLSNHYGGKTGKDLSMAIRRDGYDGIVTTEGNVYTREIVDITMF